MKICKIYIKDHLIFKDFELDLTYPEWHEKAGEPLEKVCFIGRNGTGKTTLLELIYAVLPQLMYYRRQFITVKVQINDQYFYFCSAVAEQPMRSVIFRESIDEQEGWINELAKTYYNTKQYAASLENYQSHLLKENEHYELLGSISFDTSRKALLSYITAEGEENQYIKLKDVPETSVDEAIKLFSNFPGVHKISSDTVKDFWRLLIFLMKKREDDYRNFEKQGGNLDRTVREVRADFDKDNPHILEDLAGLWNDILEPAGLEFDYQNANNPVQLADNLKAYIKLKATGNPVQYNQLSSGIRNFIFKVGHLFALYFNREIKHGFLLIDEPENSLYPDFLYDIVDKYDRLSPNTQMFVSTHNPIIATQFEPFERFIFDFNEDGSVYYKRGYTPVGDDPNDILFKDFGLRSIYTQKGLEKWERYRALKKMIPQTENAEEKDRLIEEYMKIGNEYNFSPNAIS